MRAGGRSDIDGKTGNPTAGGATSSRRGGASASRRSDFTRSFEDQVAWLACECSKRAVSELMRIAWLSVGRILERVAAEKRERFDPLDHLVRIGIDEIAHRKGQRYLTVVVDHDSGLLVWAAPGRDKKTLDRFFELLGPERSKRIELVAADGAAWIEEAVRARCPQAAICLDPFHVVQWATAALDEVRRQVWNQARRAGQTAEARSLKGARFCLWKNPDDLTARQQARLAEIARTNEPLYRAYLLKEQLRQALKLPAAEALALLEQWLAWARRSRLPAFVKLAQQIAAHLGGIAAALTFGLSNARTESVNTRIRLIARRAFGFHSPEALIALSLLALGGLCPPLPGRNA
ncbi:MAG TPA: ISL3 family transposase [Gaiellaceae bacterium]|nr:ISL3 family transposase [Gaiellaceae bacterium]